MSGLRLLKHNTAYSHFWGPAPQVGYPMGGGRCIWAAFVRNDRKGLKRNSEVLRVPTPAAFVMPLVRNFSLSCIHTDHVPF